VRASGSSRRDLRGRRTQQAVRDVGGGKLTATVKDADGNVIGLIQSP
jgi:hypothetical protein